MTQETSRPLNPDEPGGEMEHNDPRRQDDLAKVQCVDDGAGGEDRSFDPSHVDANLTREQGNGVGQRELDAQRDPTRADSTEHFGQMGPAGGGDGRSDVEHAHGAGGVVEEALAVPRPDPPTSADGSSEGRPCGGADGPPGVSRPPKGGL